MKHNDEYKIGIAILEKLEELSRTPRLGVFSYRVLRLKDNFDKGLVQQMFYRYVDRGFIKGKKQHDLTFYVITDKGINYLRDKNQMVKNGQKLNGTDRLKLFKKYDFHPQVKKVANDLFRDGYYKEAILNSFIEVVNYVKMKAENPITTNGRALDGDDLMNKVFGCDGSSVPIIKFNDLSDDPDRDEQRGLMYIFKGIVGIRNKKAHLNFIQNDPIKTIEYLSLASLLIRLLDENKSEK